MDYRKILSDAYAAATEAMLQEWTKNPNEHPFNCGFAWVTVTDSRGAFPAWCRQCIGNEPKLEDGRSAEVYFGAKGYPTGWTFWCPGEWPKASRYRQDMRFYKAAAHAFSAVLEEAGIPNTVGSRLD